MENLHIMGCWPSRIINQRRELFPAPFDSFTLLWVNVRKRLERAEAWHQNDEEKQIDVADSALPLSFFSFFFYLPFRPLTHHLGGAGKASLTLRRQYILAPSAAAYFHQS